MSDLSDSLYLVPLDDKRDDKRDDGHGGRLHGLSGPKKR